MKTKVTCITCPKGCEIEVDWDEERKIVNEISGNTCKRGAEYAEAEVLHPERILTTTVRMRDGSLLPVRSKKPIPKELMLKAMKVIRGVSVDGPVTMGDVIVENILETGIDIVASCDCM